MKLYQKIGLSLFLMIGTGAFAQELDANLQLRPRYEYRNGFKATYGKTGPCPLLRFPTIPIEFQL